MPEGRSVGYLFYAKDQFAGVAQKVMRSLDQVERSMDKVGSATARTNARAAQNAKAWGALASKARAVFGAYVGAQGMRHAIRETATFEDAVNKVMSQLRDPADKRLHRERVESMIRDNARLGQSYADLGEAMSAHLSDLGFNEKGFESFGLRMKLAVGADTPITTAVMALNKIVENYPALANNEELVAATLYEVQRSGKATMAELATYAPGVASMAAGQNVAFVEAMSLFGALTRSLGSTAEAATATDSIIRALTQPSPIQRKALSRFAGITATPQEMANIGLTKQLTKLSEALQRNPQLGRLFLSERAALAAAGKLGQPGTAEELLRQIEETVAFAQEDVEKGFGLQSAFEDQLKALSTEMADARQSISDLAVIVGQELTPSVKVIADFLRRFVASEGSTVGGAVRGAFSGPGWQGGARSGNRTSAIGDLLIGAPLDIVLGAWRARQSGAAGLDPGARPKE